MLVSKLFLADMVIGGDRVRGNRREIALRHPFTNKLLGFMDAEEAAKLIFPSVYGSPTYAEVTGVNPIY